MNSTLIRTAPPATGPAAWSLDLVVLPAATAAPSALVIAVDSPVAQETSARTQVVAAAGAELTAYAAVMPFAAALRAHLQGPPSRGTPV